MKSLMILILSFLILLMSFASGWIKIHCDGNQMINSFNGIKKQSNGTYEKQEDKDGYELMYEYLNSGYTLVKHILREGETLFELQQLYGTDWRIIQKVNNINDARYLRSGQIIFVPVKVELG